MDDFTKTASFINKSKLYELTKTVTAYTISNHTKSKYVYISPFLIKKIVLIGTYYKSK